MRTLLRLASVSPFVLAAVATAAEARAQDAPASTPAPGVTASASVAPPPESRAEDYEKAGGEHREVNGHRFITPTFEGFSAFTNSSILFEQGFGAYIANFTVKTGIPGFGQVQPALFQYHQLFAGQIAIANRVSIDLRARGTADIGSNTKNLLAYGVIADVEAGGTPKVRVFTLDKIGLTFSVGVNIAFEHSVSLSPLSILSAVAKGGRLDKGISQSNDYVISPIAMLAEGIGPLGVQVAVFPRLANGDFKQNDLFVDLHFAFDVQRIARSAPVAVTFEYEPDIFLSDESPRDASAVSHQIAVGAYYSGRRDFSVGGVFQYAAVKSAGQDANQYAGQMVMQYFF